MRERGRGRDGAGGNRWARGREGSGDRRSNGNRKKAGGIVEESEKCHQHACVTHAVAVCCSVLQCVAVSYSKSQCGVVCGAVCDSALQRVAECYSAFRCAAVEGAVV